MSSAKKASKPPTAAGKGGKVPAGAGGKTGGNDYRIPASSSWANAWKIFAGIGAGGLVVSAIGYFADPGRFAYSYLFAFFLFLTLALGGIFFVLIDRLTSAGWSIAPRRTAEFFASGSPVFMILFLPLLLCLGTLYPWLGEKTETVATAHAAQQDPQRDTHEPEHSDKGAPGLGGTKDPMPASHAGPAGEPARDGHAAPHGQHGEHGQMGAAHGGHHGDPEEAQEEELLAHKSPWLNKTGFILRAILYLVAFAVIGWLFFGYSTKQDATKDPRYTVLAQRYAPIATFVFGFTLTGAAFDWLMSLLPSWYSTIFGVTVFAGSVVAMYATLIITTMALNNAGLLKNAVNVEHYHDLGKLLFGFLVFWGYVSFAQFMLIWYASIPEEVTFYHHRWEVGPWKTVSLVIVFCHFVIPFFLLLSRNTKRRLGMLRLGAIWLLVMHAVEMYWFVMPYYAGGEWSFHWLDVTCFLGVGGVYIAVVLNRMTKHPLIPVGDPRLSRSLTFENA